MVPKVYPSDPITTAAPARFAQPRDATMAKAVEGPPTLALDATIRVAIGMCNTRPIPNKKIACVAS